MKKFKKTLAVCYIIVNVMSVIIFTSITGHSSLSMHNYLRKHHQQRFTINIVVEAPNTSIAIALRRHASNDFRVQVQPCKR
jgi:hypothetical protein